MKKRILFISLFLIFVLLTLSGCDLLNKIPGLGGQGNNPDGDTPHEHSFVDGECSCGEKDPDYKPEPPHEHEYVYTESGEGHVGTCACNATTEVLPHTYGADDKCTACGAEKPSVTPPVPGDDEGDFSGRY